MGKIQNKAAVIFAAVMLANGVAAVAQYTPGPPAPPPPLPPPPPPLAPPAPLPIPIPPPLPAPLPLPPVLLPPPVLAPYTLQGSEPVVRPTRLTPYYVPGFPGWSSVKSGDLQRYINKNWIFNDESIEYGRRGYIGFESKRAPDGRGLCLEVPASQFKDGGLVIAGPCTGHVSQYWEFDYNKSWGWQIVNNPDKRDARGYRMCLDHYPAKAAAGVQVRVYPCHGIYSVFRGTRAENNRPLRDSQRWNWHFLANQSGASAVISPSFVQSERYQVVATCLDVGPYSQGSMVVLVRCLTPFETKGAPTWRPATP